MVAAAMMSSGFLVYLKRECCAGFSWLAATLSIVIICVAATSAALALLMGRALIILSAMRCQAIRPGTNSCWDCDLQL